MPTWPNIIALIGAVDLSNALDGSLAFASERETHENPADNSKDFSGYGLATSLMNDADRRLAGYPLALDVQRARHASPRAPAAT